MGLLPRLAHPQGKFSLYGALITRLQERERVPRACDLGIHCLLILHKANLYTAPTEGEMQNNSDQNTFKLSLIYHAIR